MDALSVIVDPQSPGVSLVLAHFLVADKLGMHGTASTQYPSRRASLLLKSFSSVSGRIGLIDENVDLAVC